MSPLNATTSDSGSPVTPRRRTPARPYANKRNAPVSITTAISVLSKPLEWGASKEAAIFATMHRDELAQLSDDDSIDRIRRHFRGVWDGRAGIGTLVHAVNEAWTWGETVDISAEVDRLANARTRAVKIWQGHEPEVVAVAGPYIDGLERFWNDFAPTTIATEEVVRHAVEPEAPYIGQRDWVADCRGRRLLLEIKTTANQDGDKGLYWDSWRLQLAAQRFASHIVTYNDDGIEDGACLNYPVDACAVLHLRGDGRYQLFEVEVGPSEHYQFLKLVDLHAWLNGPGKRGGIDLTPQLAMEDA